MVFLAAGRGFASNHLHGYSKIFLENRGSASQGSSVRNFSHSNRISILKSYGDVAGELSYQIIPQICDCEWSETDGFQMSKFRIQDPDPILVSGDLDQNNYRVVQNLDRLFITFRPLNVTFKLGRQPLSWGSSRFMNPTDIFAPISLDAIDREERSGVDVLRLSVYSGQAELEMGGVFASGDLKPTHVPYLKFIDTLQDLDYSLIAADLFGRLFLGLDIQADVNGLGAYWETGYLLGRDRRILRTTFGLQYMFANSLQLTVELHFNSAGAEKKDQYADILADTDLQLLQLLYLAESYLSSQLSQQITPLFGLSFGGICNGVDGSMMFLAQLEWNIANDQYVDGGAFLGKGILGSEFGGYTDTFYTSYRFYF